MISQGVFHMKKSILFLIVFLLSACQSAPQVTVTLTPPPTETPLPTPTATITPTSTPTALTLEQLDAMQPSQILAAAPEIANYTPLRVIERFVIYQSAAGLRDLVYDMTTREEIEIPQYKICNNEKFFDCEISKMDILDGKYWLWLNTLDVKFDPNKIKDVPLVVDTNDYIGWMDRTTVYHDSGRDLPSDFSDPATAPFARNVTSGVILYNDNGVKTFAVVRPVFFYDKATGQTYPVITLETFYDHYEGRDHDPRDSRYNRNFNNWMKNYKVTSLAVGCYDYAGVRSCAYSLINGIQDPILLASEGIYPDMEARLLDFATGNYSALSKPGLVVQTTSDVYPDDNRYR